uniref:Antibiotic biosynthesis monooxygenase n=1 Tax=bacterium enrichment culture clone fosmid MGS-K1 TaxID=1549356 RepID=A0A0B5KC41_9BACT|nr:antibiotic biosynthesis monooxygenase [bacterium enrichment culture clone fosmid MGS-K1]
MVRIIVERRVKEGKDNDLLEMLRELRARALHQPGYVSGETLVGNDDPSLYVVISNWASGEDWEKWANSKQRKDLDEKIKPLLSTPSQVTVLRYLERT